MKGWWQNQGDSPALLGIQSRVPTVRPVWIQCLSSNTSVICGYSNCSRERAEEQTQKFLTTAVANLTCFLERIALFVHETKPRHLHGLSTGNPLDSFSALFSLALLHN